MLKRITLALISMLPIALAGAETLERFDPGPAALAEHTGKGQWVILKIWVSDCHVCNQEAHQYVDFHEFHQDNDAVMLGLSLDGEDRAAALDFIQRHEVTYPNLIVDYAAGAGWYTSVTGRPWVGTPTFLVYDPAGELHTDFQLDKAADAVELFDVIHTIDREKIAKAIASEMAKQGKSPKLFVQVNTGMEEQKAGVDPDKVADFVGQCRSKHGLTISGLMCIPPFDENPGPHFALLRKLAAEAGVEELSMGMSGDYADAIAEGATMIRVGTAIFGKRQYS